MALGLIEWIQATENYPDVRERVLKRARYKKSNLHQLKHWLTSGKRRIGIRTAVKLEAATKREEPQFRMTRQALCPHLFTKQ